MLEYCEVQVGEMQGATESGLPEADDLKAGRRCRATQQIACLHKQYSALHVKDYLYCLSMKILNRMCIRKDAGKATTFYGLGL